MYISEIWVFHACKLDYLMPVKYHWIFWRDHFIFSKINLFFYFKKIFLLGLFLLISHASLPALPTFLCFFRNAVLAGSTRGQHNHTPCSNGLPGFLFSWQVWGALVRTKHIITVGRNPQWQSIVVNSNTRSGKFSESRWLVSTARLDTHDHL